MRHGDSFLIRIASPNHDPYSATIYRRGDTTPLTGIADVTPDDRPSIRLTTLGLPPGDYDAVMRNTEGRELARSRFAIIPRDGLATLQVTAAVTPTFDIPVTFSAAPGFKLDWIGIYKKADPSVYNYLGFTYTGARINGTLTFPAAELYTPLTPGDYEARLLLDDKYQVLAVAGFTVTAP